MANGLINLQTDLTSLKYTSMPLGSDKPLITKDIGQAPGSQIGVEISRRIDDTSRIAQMLVSKPGIKYLLHEAELQQIGAADKIRKARKGGKSVAGAVLGQLGNTVVNTLKIVGSTIAQVPVNGTGTHFLKGFRTDTYLQPSGGNTRSKFAQFFGAGGIEGAPLALEGKPITGKVQSNFGEANEKTGDFQIAAESELDYDEKINSLIPGQSAYTSAEQGTAIIQDNLGQEGWKPYTSTGVKENFVSRDANKIISQSIFADKKIQNKSRSPITGSIRSSPIELISPIGGPPLLIPQKETTAAEGSLGISNKNVVGDVSETPNDSLGKTYSSTDTYTGTDAIEATRRAGSGKNISMRPENLGLEEENKYTPYTFNRDNTYGEVVAGDVVQDSTGRIVDGIPLGEILIPRKISLKRLKIGVNTGSIEVVNRSGEYPYTPTIEDFRSGSGSPVAYNYGLNTINKERRVGLGNQGRIGVTSYVVTDPLSIDKLNQQDISNNRVDGTKPDDVRDLAKFFFEIITPDGSKFLYFRALIDSVDDSYTATWNPTKYVGRAEEFYTYGGFSRDINVKFKIAAATREEMKPLYRKMVYLASATAPTYGGEGFMRGTIARLTVGSYFDQLPGVITSVKYNLIEDMPWEIAMQQPEGNESGVQELPMGLECTVAFKVIHDFAPQTGLYHYFTSNEKAKDYLV